MTFAQWIASGGGIGHVRFAPGTVASLAALPIGAAAMWIAPGLLLGLALLAAIGGHWAVRVTGEKDDPGWIVIDEFAGQWIALLGLAQVSWPGLIAAFALFRLFDILKPGPVSWADRKHNAFGVMADDVIAGLMAAAILLAIRTLFPSAGL